MCKLKSYLTVLQLQHSLVDDSDLSHLTLHMPCYHIFLIYHWSPNEREKLHLWSLLKITNHSYNCMACRSSQIVRRNSAQMTRAFGFISETTNIIGQKCLQPVAVHPLSPNGMADVSVNSACQSPCVFHWLPIMWSRYFNQKPITLVNVCSSIQHLLMVSL